MSEPAKEFVDRYQNREVVAVQGLGYVGAVMALVVADADDADYAVIGVEQSDDEGRRKVRALNEGRFPIDAADSTVDTLHQRALEAGNFLATTDDTAYEFADIVVIDINLDVEKRQDEERRLQGYSVELEPFERACRAIAERCKRDVLVVVETTVPPGTCREVVEPIFREAFEQRSFPKDFKIGHSFERVMPGADYVDSIQNFYRVYAGIDEASAEATEHFLESFISTDRYPLTRLQSTTASEMTKVLENSYRAMNIAFVQEWTEFAEEAGVDLYEVTEAIRQRPTHQNLMAPGLGVGGYCLPKDPLLAAWAREAFFGGNRSDLTESEHAVEINDRMPRHTFDRIVEAYDGDLAGANVLFLGVSYRENIGDTRQSPVAFLYDLCDRAGADIVLHDPFVDEWAERERMVADDLETVLAREGFDIVVLTTPHDTYRANPMLIEHLLDQRPLLIHDAWGLLSDEEIETLTRKHQVQVTGRGDL